MPDIASPDFKRCLQFVLKWEGGYVNNPADHGGATNQGITQASYDTYRKLNGLLLQDVKYLKNEERDAIYYYNYWKPMDCDEMQWPENLCWFDFAVNSGLARAKRYQGLCKTEGSDPVECCIRRRKNFFMAIGVGSQRQFLKGWLNRLAALSEEINKT